MKRALLFIAFILTACASSPPVQHARFLNRLELSPPGNNQAAIPAALYIRSVQVVNWHRAKALLISGKLPNGCARLKKAVITGNNDSLHLKLRAWQPAEATCTQALVPFSFIFDQFPPQKLRQASVIQINNQRYKITRP